MEDCELQLSLPYSIDSNSSLMLGNGTNKVDLWLLDSPHPLYAKTLTWNNRPPRRKKIDTINVELGLQYSYNFTCPMNSVWAFELSAGNEETNVRWSQTWGGPSPSR